MHKLASGTYRVMHHAMFHLEKDSVPNAKRHALWRIVHRHEAMSYAL